MAKGWEECLREVVGQRREDADLAARRFGEVGFAEQSLHAQRPDSLLDQSAYGFDQVEDEGRAVGAVGVRETHGRVESESAAGDGGFDLGEPVPQVE
jgi:hypothetical protein